jgi:hypothetical protein
MGLKSPEPLESDRDSGRPEERPEQPKARQSFADSLQPAEMCRSRYLSK